MALKLTCASKMLIKQTHFSSRARPNKRASTFPFKSEWQRNTTAANTPSLYSGNVSRTLFCWKYQLQMLSGGRKDGRFVCLCWFGLDMPREPFKPFVRLNFFLCYICRLRFKQTTGNMKARRRYYGERMTTRIGRAQEGGNTRKGWRKKRKSWCKEGWGDWKEAEIEVMRCMRVCVVNANKRALILRPETQTPLSFSFLHKTLHYL